MWFSGKQKAQQVQELREAQKTPAGGEVPGAEQKQITTKRRGDAAEAAARDFLVAQGLRFIEANFRTPGRGGGEIDLIMGAADGTLVFVEVRQRSSASHGGAGASIGAGKQQRIVLAARHYLMRFSNPPPCRFDVVLVQGSMQQSKAATMEWLAGAFDAW